MFLLALLLLVVLAALVGTFAVSLGLLVLAVVAVMLPLQWLLMWLADIDLDG